jgi:ammonia channel protein AmtB
MFSSTNLQLVGIGAMILITGFLSFNGGSLGSMTNPGDGDIIARVISNTVLGGTGGSIAILFASKMGLCGPPAWNFSFTVNAALIGMVIRTKLKVLTTSKKLGTKLGSIMEPVNFLNAKQGYGIRKM